MRHLEFAPAKLNLWLRVHGKREDGFHEIETLMVPIATVKDELSFDIELGDGELIFECNDVNLETDHQNLVLRALNALESESGKKFCGKIKLDKKIPLGAGLGGGSSDAAATLRAVNGMLGNPFSTNLLHSLASRIGSDVPFFLEGRSAICSGRGEKIQTLEDPVPDHSVVLVKPEFGVSSAWAYSKWEKAEPLPEVSYVPQSITWGAFYNDLELPVFQKYISLANMKMWLLDQSESEVALMSGSGSTLYVLCDDYDKACSLVEKIRIEFGTAVWTAISSIGK